MVGQFIQKIKRQDNRLYAILYRMGKSARTIRVPTGFPFRPVYRTLYYLHMLFHECLRVTVKFLYYEPMFRARCEHVGERLSMECLPWIAGNGFIRVGDDCVLSGKVGFRFNDKVNDRVTISIGDSSFVGHNVSLNAAEEICIGSHCLIASEVRISDFDGHPICPEARRRHETVAKSSIHPVVIEDDVWIGRGAVILKGIHIGAGSVIGARAVVTRDIPAGSIAVGNPARVISKVEDHSDREGALELSADSVDDSADAPALVC